MCGIQRKEDVLVSSFAAPYNAERIKGKRRRSGPLFLGYTRARGGKK